MFSSKEAGQIWGNGWPAVTLFYKRLETSVCFNTTIAWNHIYNHVNAESNVWWSVWLSESIDPTFNLSDWAEVIYYFFYFLRLLRRITSRRLSIVFRLNTEKCKMSIWHPTETNPTSSLQNLNRTTPALIGRLGEAPQVLLNLFRVIKHKWTIRTQTNKNAVIVVVARVSDRLTWILWS